MKNNKRVRDLKSQKECADELAHLEAGGGIKYGGGKIIPLSTKAKHIAQRMIEMGNNSYVWSVLAPEADWEGQVALPARIAKAAARVFDDSSVKIVRSSHSGFAPRPPICHPRRKEV